MHTLTGDWKNTGLADFNGDGNLDIYAGSITRSDFFIYLGDGQGAFSKYLVDLGRAGPDFHAVAIGNVNGDGMADVVVGSGRVTE